MLLAKCDITFLTMSLRCPALRTGITRFTVQLLVSVALTTNFRRRELVQFCFCIQESPEIFGNMCVDCIGINLSWVKSCLHVAMIYFLNQCIVSEFQSALLIWDSSVNWSSSIERSQVIQSNTEKLINTSYCWN